MKIQSYSGFHTVPLIDKDELIKDKLKRGACRRCWNEKGEECKTTHTCPYKAAMFDSTDECNCCIDCRDRCLLKIRH